MPDSPQLTPDSPQLTKEKIAEREARLADALRDNLRRRKEQARSRAAERDIFETPGGETPAGPCDRQRGKTSPTG
jgi:hypothetical protein